jgi:hypothetical protein
MAGTGPQDLHALAEEFLDACIASLDTIPVFAPGLGGAPERSFISPGTPAFDCCDQLTVHVGGAADAATAPGALAAGRKATFGKVNLVQLIATITRCVPIVTAKDWPTPTEMNTAAEQLNADGWALWNHTFNLVAAGQLFQLCGEVYWDALRSITPSGGCGGWTLTVRVRLDGYQEVVGT